MNAPTEESKVTDLVRALEESLAKAQEARRVKWRESCPECGGGWTKVPGCDQYVDDHTLDCSRLSASSSATRKETR